ncbi:MAG TPA: LCCL domain-containing protein [Candidatus Eremiobacteraceae bacterium]|nr:LCCL domain-containing protein [Candidatus Eremiobacteraceae bacterium]
MTHYFIRIAMLTAATSLFACPPAVGQTPTSTPSAAPPMAAPAALDIGDCPDAAYGFELGKTYSCACPPSASPGAAAGGAVYGTSVYTSDSNICAAAVHAGALKPATASHITVQMVESPPVFKGTTQNGVKSDVWTTATSAAFQFPPAR